MKPTTTFDAWKDIWDMICKEQAKAHDKLLFDELKNKQQMVEPVLICSRKIKQQIESKLPNMFCILATDLCGDDKAYMVTDKEMADNVRQNLNWMNRREGGLENGD